MSRPPLIRPEIRRWLGVHAELLSFGGVLLAGLWLSMRGGWILAVLGGVLALGGAVLAVGAWRRLPFRRTVAAEGLVEIVEGAIRYYGAHAPGAELPLRDLAEIRLMRVQGRAHWRLRSVSGEALLVPVDAAGAAGLADAFTALPGLELGRVSAALSAVADGDGAMRTVWLRRG
ncbi:hypothetical protein D3P06_01545 [Paracoccus aestuarii]|uniref:Uncharacterized protein n=1 Tax=Paracoccus aestuarii TaxID=453842 RepID=A0A419A2E0_9RHOB|nr:hypothetical protein [Paracoccus aestuarii]RJL07160.1 hypothetical protein D3P06_01545 [Paracoccus aestuarii]WCQ99574.1 hypothetical protein JHW48_02160 [Paracoccus aestuarii]